MSTNLRLQLGTVLIVIVACLHGGDITFAQEAEAPSLTGQLRWIKPKSPLLICSAVDMTAADKPCFLQRAGSFTVGDYHRSRRAIGRPHYAVILADGRTGFADALAVKLSDTEARHSERVKAAADCDRRGGVTVGMSKEQVFASCWGKPLRRNVTVTARGTHEQLIYRGGYLYFDNGRLSTIQFTTKK